MNTRRMRVGLMSAGLIVAILLPMAVGGKAFLYAHCVVSGCDPMGGTSTEQLKQQEEKNSQATVVATNLLYGVNVNGYPLIEAIKKYAYCREGSGEPGAYRCTDAPTESQITDAVESFQPHEGGVIDLFNPPAYQLDVTRNGETLLHLEKNSFDGPTSTALIMIPIAGGENVKVRYEQDRGSITLGVTG